MSDPDSLVERLRRRVDALEAVDVRMHGDWIGGPTPSLMSEAAAELTRLRAANKALVEAAGPFVHVLDNDVSPTDDDTDMFQPMYRHNVARHIRIGDLRALSRAVEAAAPSLTGGDDA